MALFICEDLLKMARRLGDGSLDMSGTKEFGLNIILLYAYFVLIHFLLSDSSNQLKKSRIKVLN